MQEIQISGQRKKNKRSMSTGESVEEIMEEIKWEKDIP